MEKNKDMADLSFISMVLAMMIMSFALSKANAYDQSIVMMIGGLSAFVSFFVGYSTYCFVIIYHNKPDKFWLPPCFALILPLVSDFFQAPVPAEVWNLAIGLYLFGISLGIISGITMVHLIVKRAGIWR